jgi:hypothetical protein
MHTTKKIEEAKKQKSHYSVPIIVASTQTPINITLESKL